MIGLFEPDVYSQNLAYEARRFVAAEDEEGDRNSRQRRSRTAARRSSISAPRRKIRALPIMGVRHGKRQRAAIEAFAKREN
jgi:hypothetical protein